MRNTFVIICCLGASTLVACAATPTITDSGVRVEALTSVETSWRREAFEQQHGGRTEIDETQRVNRIAAQLTELWWSGPPVTAGVLRSAVPNAYVLPTGHIYVTAGILDLICSDDELAAVMAHELAHLMDLSTFDPAGRTPEERLIVEADADGRAVEMLLDSRYEPAALGTMIRRLSDAQPAGWAEYRCEKLAQLIDPTSSPAD